MSKLNYFVVMGVFIIFLFCSCSKFEFASQQESSKLISKSASSNNISSSISNDNDEINITDFDSMTVETAINNSTELKQVNNKNDITKLINYINALKKEKIETQDLAGENYFIEFDGKDKYTQVAFKGKMIGIAVMDNNADSEKIWNWFKINDVDLSQLMIIYNNLTVVKNNSAIPATAKPVIYLYPLCKQETTIKLDYNGKLICTYPVYNNFWDVTAFPNGKIINETDNKEYSYLYWEGIPIKTDWDFSKGYVVEGKDTINFLQKKLSDLGLTPNEYNEFIVYWLPFMENNNYNLITFQNQAYEDIAKLDIKPKPDSMLRIFMVFKPLDKPISINPTIIKPFERKGFTVVEWGGTEIQ
jgi:hypothetical protein